MLFCGDQCRRRGPRARPALRRSPLPRGRFRVRRRGAPGTRTRGRRRRYFSFGPLRLGIGEGRAGGPLAEVDKPRSTTGSLRTTAAAAVTQPRTGGGQSRLDDPDDFEQRRRRQCEQAQRDYDRKIKEAVQGGGVRHGDGRHGDGDNELERCWRWQQEQDESDWRVKEGVREQTAAAWALRGAAAAGTGRRE